MLHASGAKPRAAECGDERCLLGPLSRSGHSRNSKWTRAMRLSFFAMACTNTESAWSILGWSYPRLRLDARSVPERQALRGEHRLRKPLAFRSPLALPGHASGAAGCSVSAVTQAVGVPVGLHDSARYFHVIPDISKEPRGSPVRCRIGVLAGNSRAGPRPTRNYP